MVIRSDARRDGSVLASKTIRAARKQVAGEQEVRRKAFSSVYDRPGEPTAPTPPAAKPRRKAALG
jgi:hypothetical protein